MGSFLRLLDELMQDDNLAIRHRAIQYSRNALCSLEPKFEQASAHGPSMGHAEIRTIDLHSLGIPEEPGQKARRESENIMFHEPIVEGNGPGHGRIIAHPLYTR